MKRGMSGDTHAHAARARRLRRSLMLGVLALAARILHAPASQLEATGQAASVIHRREIGRPGDFLAAVRRVLRGRAPARWPLAPWPRHAPSHGLLVEPREAVA